MSENTKTVRLQVERARTETVMVDVQIDVAEFEEWALDDGGGALELAAEELYLPGSTATGYYASEQVSGYNDAERDIEAWLTLRARALRAARLTAPSGETTT